MNGQQLTRDGTGPQPVTGAPMTRQQVARPLAAMFPVSRDLADVLAAIILGRAVYAATLTGVCGGRGTFGLFLTAGQGERWAARRNQPTSNFVFPVLPFHQEDT
jgi:hypothetical protein